MMYRYLFGPVPSRRLGISLGIDLVPLKTCTLNCIYCECGPTTDLTLQRKEYVPLTAVIDEVAHFLAHNPKPDYLTFSGSGEPILNSGIGEALNYLKDKVPEIPVAILTNGTMLSQLRVREEIKGASLVMPSLDAVTDKIFSKVNRPHPQLRMDNIIEGLIQFRKEYSEQIWLEIFVVPGLNDTKQELAALKQVIQQIGPDRVQLNTLDRPAPVESVRAANRQELKNILDFWQLPNAEIIVKAPERKQLLAYRNDVESAILEIIARRPCTLPDLVKILGLHLNEINKYLDVLEADEKIKVVLQDRGYFYKINTQ